MQKVNKLQNGGFAEAWMNQQKVNNCVELEDVNTPGQKVNIKFSVKREQTKKDCVQKQLPLQMSKIRVGCFYIPGEEYPELFPI